MRVHRSLRIPDWDGTLILQTTELNDHSLFSDHAREVDQIIDSCVSDISDKFRRLKEEIHARKREGRVEHGA